MNTLPKLIATDIDGNWTDGGMYYSESGDEFKRFTTIDSAGVLFCRKLDIPIAIITGEDSIAVKRRAEKLKINLCYTGITDKLSILQTICAKQHIKISEVAYLGDDLNDIQVIKAVGYSACPSSAPPYIQKLVTKVLTKRGGEGVFREFVEEILNQQGILQEVLNKYFINS